MEPHVSARCMLGHRLLPEVAPRLFDLHALSFQQRLISKSIFKNSEEKLEKMMRSSTRSR